MSSVQVIVYDAPQADPGMTMHLYYQQQADEPAPSEPDFGPGGRHAIFRLRDTGWRWGE